LDVGFIEVATSKDGAEEYRRIAAFNRKCGVDVREITPSEVKGLFPLAEVGDVHSGFYVEGDGRVNPVRVALVGSWSYDLCSPGGVVVLNVVALV
jgi:4-methylaminobutanoate oxidase (formaldehyde-forming)